MLIDIITYGDDIYNKLRKKNVDVKKENPFLRQLIKNMFETVQYHNGIVLAAPQVGRNLNMFIVNTPQLKEVFINPEILLDGLPIQISETSLTFPGMQFPVDRRQKIKIRYSDQNWTLKLREFDDVLAIVIQQGYDHLKGKLIID